jgi:hypothetical protein
VFDRCTDATRRIVFHAIVEGGVRAGGTIGTEHLLIALLSAEVPVGTRRLWARFGVRRSIARSLMPALPPRPEASFGQISYSRRARRMLEHACEVAASRRSLIHPEHLIYALFEDPSSTAAMVIARAGVDPLAVRQHIAQTWEATPAAGHRRIVRLFPDAGCDWPLWEDGQIEPDDLALSGKLATDLRRWTDYWIRHFDHDRGWDDPAHCKEWHDWGYELADRLHDEVDDFADVVPHFEWIR